MPGGWYYLASNVTINGRVNLAGDTNRLGAAGRGAGVPALVAHGHGQEFGEARFIVDGEHADRSAVGAGDGFRGLWA